MRDPKVQFKRLVMFLAQEPKHISQSHMLKNENDVWRESVTGVKNLIPEQLYAR
ncbi:hypothetical protein NPIL_527141, partial [Nephila pilipes]